jgi:uncharacterized membrane protein
MPTKPVIRRSFGYLLKGFVVMLPILATLGITFWLWGVFESILGKPLELILGTAVARANQPGVWRYIHYYPGIGTLLSLVIIFFVGMFINAWIVKGLLNWVEDLLERVPLVKSIYGSFRDLIGFFSSKEGKRTNQVVVVTLGGAELLGLMTREDFSDLPAGVGGDGKVAVYVPMSYQLGGFTVMVPRSAVRMVDMRMEEAMRFAVTAGMATRPTGEGAAKAN